MTRRAMIPIMAGAAETAGQVSHRSNRDRLIGVWKLHSVEVTVDGKTVFPYGENPIGRLTYDTAGRTSAQVTSTTKGASVLFFGFHCSFTIMEPSGKGTFPGAPALYALIIAGLATITLRTSSVRAEEATDQFSYPLKSENAIPPGDVSEYLSVSCPRP